MEARPDREIKLRMQQERGARASALLNNDLLKGAFEKIDADLTAAWEGTKSDQIQTREDAWRSKVLLRNLRKVLEKHVTDGNAAAKELLAMPSRNIVERMIK